MSAQEPLEIYDVLGIGYGPSNLATSIALSDRNGKAPEGSKLSAIFIEQYPIFQWHPAMMLPGSIMQIAFLKDLATMRDPTSSYTFLSYLHEVNRLATFINLSTFTPTRREYANYMGWAARKVANDVNNGIDIAYGESVVSVAVPEAISGSDAVTYLKVTSRCHESGELKVRYARNLALSTGGAPAIPEVLKGVVKERPDTAIHTSQYLYKIDNLLHHLGVHSQRRAASFPPSPPTSSGTSSGTSSASSAVDASESADLSNDLSNRLNDAFHPARPAKLFSKRRTRVAVIGSGQSAAETFLHLHSHVPVDCDVDLLIRRAALRPSDDSAFSNEVFDPIMTSYMFEEGPRQGERPGLGGQAVGVGSSKEQARARLLADAHATNYSVVNPKTLHEIYEVMYSQRLEDDIADQPAHERSHMAIKPYSELVSARTVAASGGVTGFELKIRHALNNEERTEHYDALVLGTGYDRQGWRALFSSMTQVAQLLDQSEMEQAEVDRNYRLVLPANIGGRQFKPKIWVQGCNEKTHGISDSLLSVLAVRSGEVVADIEAKI